MVLISFAHCHLFCSSYRYDIQVNQFTLSCLLAMMHIYVIYFYQWEHLPNEIVWEPRGNNPVLTPHICYNEIMWNFIFLVIFSIINTNVNQCHHFWFCQQLETVAPRKHFLLLLKTRMLLWKVIPVREDSV